ncbi:MAG: hypothetical protein K2J28_04540, partial [Duncaniella sp.]|nr:hypothetical protein [Duncaniella sp.]
MKNFLTYLLLASAALPASASISDDKGLAPYVYPQNSTAWVPRPAYLADGLSYLALSPDGKKIVKYETASGKEIETVMDVTHTRETPSPSLQSFVLSHDG